MRRRKVIDADGEKGRIGGGFIGREVERVPPLASLSHCIVPFNHVR